MKMASDTEVQTIETQLIALKNEIAKMGREIASLRKLFEKIAVPMAIKGNDWVRMKRLKAEGFTEHRVHYLIGKNPTKKLKKVHGGQNLYNITELKKVA